ncbi:MAG: AbrB/MazE/SpoVT family DNA-binding domain-containing protein [Verrucomicrobiota bacterium]
MTTSLLSPKYQVVIPKEIRKSMNLKPGQRLQFKQVDGKIEIRPILTPDQLVGFLKGKTKLPFEREKQDRPLP